jgi:tyrosyl-tRNA synthetase
MIRKLHGVDTPACCASIKLLLKPDGTKFGKSEGGSLFLDKKLTSPYTMYQFLYNQPDNMVIDLLKRFTFLTKPEIEELEEKNKVAPFKREAHKKLAAEVIKDIHGIAEVEKCEKISQCLFAGDLDKLDTDELFTALNNNVKTYHATTDDVLCSDVLIELKIVSSKTEFRKLIDQNSLKVNNENVTDYNIIINRAKAIDNKFTYIKKGKKDFALVV